jgi:IclR family mhp operon transcriptional activator
MEISRDVDLPYPTAFRIIQTLMYEGLIECEPTRKHYRATPLVQSLSRGYDDGGRLLEAARPRMVALTRAHSWPVSVTTHVGRSMVVRDSTHTLTSLTFCNYTPGFTLPLLECASGHAYLAHVSTAERASLLAGLEAFERRSEMLELFKNDRLVQHIRDNGYATCQRNPHTAFPGKTSSIGVPVFQNGQVAAALTLVFFASAMPMGEAVQRYAGALKDAAREVSRDLGAPGAAVPARLAELAH